MALIGLSSAVVELYLNFWETYYCPITKVTIFKLFKYKVKVNDGSHSLLPNLSDQIPSTDQVDKPIDSGGAIVIWCSSDQVVVML